VRAPYVLGVGILAFVLASAGRPSAQPAADGKALFAQVCSQCHALSIATKLHDGPEGWKRRVDLMVLRGAQMTPAEESTVVAYLAANYGPGATVMSSGPTPAPPLLTASGEDLVAGHCLLCHDSGRLVDARRTRIGWTAIVTDMVGRMPPGFATPQQERAIVDYLTAHYGQ
jgi:mono/diheme cytochrome c family protein